MLLALGDPVPDLRAPSTPGGVFPATVLTLTCLCLASTIVSQSIEPGLQLRQIALEDLVDAGLVLD